MYANDTILTLKTQRDPDPETGEAFPYNRVQVVGQSPVSHEVKGDWRGADAEGVILKPLTNFGATLDEPFGKCVKLYDVESIPEVTVEAESKIKVVDATSASAGPTPEEVFAEKAPGTPPEPGQKRARSPRPDTSPLGEARNEAASGPLGDVEAPAIEPEPDASPLTEAAPVPADHALQPEDEPVVEDAPPVVKSPLDE